MMFCCLRCAILFTVIILSQASANAVNVAIHKGCTLDPAPNYARCMDPCDRLQLTDGYVGSSDWSTPSTVGWRDFNWIVVTIELEKIQPIRGVSFNTAAGTSGVTWPKRIFIFTADVNKEFHQIGDLVALDSKHGALPIYGTAATHRFWTDDLQTHGRYVAVAFSAEPYQFVDEIEIDLGDPNWLSLPFEGLPVENVRKYLDSIVEWDGIMRRLNTDIADLREETRKLQIDSNTRDGVLSELNAIEKELKNIPMTYDDSFKAILPLNSQHSRLFRAHAKLWEAQGLSPLTVWQSGTWDALPLLGEPNLSLPAFIDMCMMSNEYRAASINISNAAQQPKTVQLKITGLPGGTNPAYIKVHQVEWTDTKTGIVAAAALPEAVLKSGTYQITVAPGLTRQVWFTFHPTDVQANTYTGRIELASDEPQINVPLKLHVYPFDFPNLPTLHFSGADYITSTSYYPAITDKNRMAYLTCLREHFADTPWLHDDAMPYGSYDAQGNMTVNPSTAKFDATRAYWPNARQYLVFMNPGDTIGSLTVDTTAGNNAVKNWLRFWKNYFLANNIQPEQVAILVGDEPPGHSSESHIITWAKAIHAANTGIKVWEDPVYGSTSEMTQTSHDMMAASDVLCPRLTIFRTADQAYRDYFVKLRNQGKQLEFWSCSDPVRELDPYSYHRLSAWVCWQYGAQTAGFWAFGQTAGVSSWNEYSGSGIEYTPLFIDPNATMVTAGKHMEACREGIEDYEYFVMLKKAIDKAIADGTKCSAAIIEGQRLLKDGVDSVCNAASTKTFLWRETLDRKGADQLRKQILNVLFVLADPNDIKEK